MQLLKAFRSMERIRLAFVGAGGKTTAMFQLARELASPVLVTASTHLGKDQLKLADRHIILSKPGQLNQLDSNSFWGVTLFTGSYSETDERMTGLGREILADLNRLADERHYPLLIEADGSRRKPLKAPAEHEPAIPEWVNMVIVVAGLSGLGKPVSSDWVHRPELFSTLGGLQAGELITSDAIVRVLSHPNGGLKNIPPVARKVALLNQADTEILQRSAEVMAQQLMPAYDQVIVAALQNAIENSQESVAAIFEPVAGIVLAAGGSIRYGQPKFLLDWQDKPFIRHVVEKALQSGLSPVIVVIGSVIEPIIETLADLPVEIALNPEWQSGQSTSIKKGIAALPENSGAAIFLLSDQPQIPPAVIQAECDLHHRSLSPIIIPRVGDRRANPVLFDRVTFKDLNSLQGDVGGRVLFSKYEPNWLDWNDPDILLDIDTPEDYQRLMDIKK